MVHCTLETPFSWRYHLEGKDHNGEVLIEQFREEGSLIVDGQLLEIRKPTWNAGRWEILAGNSKVGEAWKPEFLSRRIEAELRGNTFVVAPVSLLSRKMTLRVGEEVLDISPDRFFPRGGARIMGSPADFEVICFGFWLTAMLWRRGIWGFPPRHPAD